MSRIRLTNKTRIANDPADMEGTRQDCGKKTRMTKYDTFDIKDDSKPADSQKYVKNLHKKDVEERNEMNVGKLRQARAWQASKLATKLAIYSLGQKAPSSMVKAQAAEFLSLGNEKLAKAVNRFAKTEYLYAEQDGQADTPKAEQPKAEDAGQADTPKAEQPKTEDAGQADTPQDTEQGTAGDCCAVAPQADLVQEQEGCAQGGEDEISDATLASLFEQNSNNLVASKKVVASTKKVGVQKLSQPKVKVASSNGVNLEEIWESAPDISKIFN